MKLVLAEELIIYCNIEYAKTERKQCTKTTTKYSCPLSEIIVLPKNND